MRTISYEVFARSALDGHRINGTVASLMADIPYLLVTGIIPPRRVLNDLLGRGVVDAGMSGGCRWDPFQIDEAEWDAMVAAIEAGASHAGYVAPAAWVTTYDEWHAWLFEHLHAVPAQQHLRLMQQDSGLAREIDQAAASGDHARVAELHLQRIRVGEELSALLRKHLTRRA